MPVDALVPNDPRVEHKFATFGDIKYHYMLANPKGKPVATVLLLHGFPDLGMGWRYQVPYLLSLGLQVIVPDMLGYGQTSAPEAVEEYSMKKMSAHIVGIVKEVTDQPIILGGHDWGGYFAWRICIFYPELVRCVFSFCIPFVPPAPVKISMDQMIARLPNFTYQKQLAGPVAEAMVDKSPERLRGFINGMFGGKTPEGEYCFNTDVGVIEENLEKIGPSTLASPEMIEHYFEEYSRHGMHGPTSWYRVRDINADDDLELAKNPDFKFKMPAMLVMAEKDAALPPRLADGQEKFFEGPFKKELILGATHWILVQCPEESNKYIGEFIKSVLGDELKASL